MNKKRRAVLGVIVGELRKMMEGIEAVHDEEEDAFDNLPESIQESERGDNMQDAIDLMDDAISSIEDAIDSIEGLL